MIDNFKATQKTCEKCGKQYMTAHQSAECPHERLVDLMTDPRLLTLSPKRYVRKVTNAYNTEEEWYRKGKEDQLAQDRAQLAKVDRLKLDSKP